MFVLNEQVNPVYSLESQNIEVSECILIISYGNLKVGRTAWEGCPNNAVLNQHFIYIHIKVCCKRTVKLGLKMLFENNRPLLVAWTL